MRRTSGGYLQRTEWNVRDSDATVLFSIQPTLSGGSKKDDGICSGSTRNRTYIFAPETRRPRRS
ncbi:MAG: hypothetical protein JOZ31_13425 [Verrucomicrobia bacterium]|nr:hypothetical protein [Verrucomicrobiota bacterium]MBV8484945.1 hypothetical protein [Verrucomicrobiota bacterium]